MGVNTVYSTSQIEKLTIDFRQRLDSLRAVAFTLQSGQANLSQLIASVQGMDNLYDQMFPMWQSLSGIRTAQENTAVQVVKVEIDDLLLTVADTMSGLTVPQTIDIGATYNPADSRAQKLSALNRDFPLKQLNIPPLITNAATTLVQAIDAYKAIA